MAEAETRGSCHRHLVVSTANKRYAVARAVSTSPDGLLAAPSEYPFNNSRHRSTSLAPSFRSTKSNVTIVEDKENSTPVSKAQVFRQQTYKIQRRFSMIDRIKGLWDPKGLVRKMERSIEFVPPHVLDEDVSTKSVYLRVAHGGFRCLMKLSRPSSWMSTSPRKSIAPVTIRSGAGSIPVACGGTLSHRASSIASVSPKPTTSHSARKRRTEASL